MAGPGIRAFHLAREIARRVPTTLVARFDGEAPSASFATIPFGTAAARNALRSARVVVGQPGREILSLGGSVRRVFDLFDPVVLELPELAPRRPRVAAAIHLRREWGRLIAALRKGDLLVCASLAQRDFYAGVLAAAGGPEREDAERWIEVPFGVEPEAPSGEAEPARDARPLILWGGGTWPWLDPETAVDAVRRLADRGTECRLVFMGSKRPNDDVSFVGRSESLAAKVRDAGDLVTWNEGWVPYAERGRWLRASRVALMLHRRTPETDYSIRTRFFDALWCGVPVVATEGGFVADLVEREDLGEVVRPADVENVVDALERLLRDDARHAACVEHLERVRPRFHWDRVAKPLVEAIVRWVE